MSIRLCVNAFCFCHIMGHYIASNVWNTRVTFSACCPSMSTENSMSELRLMMCSRVAALCRVVTRTRAAAPEAGLLPASGQCGHSTGYNVHTIVLYWHMQVSWWHATPHWGLSPCVGVIAATHHSRMSYSVTDVYTNWKWTQITKTRHTLQSLPNMLSSFRLLLFFIEESITITDVQTTLLPVATFNSMVL